MYIAERVAEAEPGKLFVPSDFSDLAGPDAVSQALSRPAKKSELTLALKALGKDTTDDALATRLAARLTDEEVDTYLRQTQAVPTGKSKRLHRTS